MCCMSESLSEMERVEALFKAIVHVLDELHQKGTLSAEEHTILVDSVWYVLDYGTRLPK